jgi:GT2 family glycosyltransferase
MLGRSDDDDRVSVIIVNWNGERFLERCLTALQAQTVRPHEIILVDNASSDGSLAIARRFPEVRIMALDSNTGFARGNNLAIASADARSAWIALLNPDAFAAPDWLETLLQAARTRSDYAVFASRLVDAADPQRLDGDGDAYHLSGLVWRIGHGHPVSRQPDQPHEVFSACAAAALYRRDALNAVGGFDEDYFCYVEDVDLGFRLRLAGHRCLLVPQSVAHHVGSGTTGGQHSDFALYHGHRNLVWTFVKNMPPALFWLLLPLHLALNLFSIAWFAWRGHGKVMLRAKRDALCSLPVMWQKRRQIQRTRTATVNEIRQHLETGTRM